MRWSSRSLAFLASASLLVSLSTACASPASPAGAPPAPAATTAGQAGAAAGSSAAAVPPARESVRIPYSALSMAQLPHWITYDAGLYDREGLDVTMDYVASSTVLAPALLSGEIGMAYAGQEVAIASGVQGGDMVIVGGGIDKPLFWLTTQPGIRGVDELRAKRIGVTRFGASSDTVLRFYLGTVGLQPDRDVTILQMGGNPEMVGGLQSGAIDAAILSPPSVFQAQQNGATILADMGDLDYPFYQDAVTTTRRFLAERPEVVKRTVRAFAQGWKLMKDEPTALAALRKYSGEVDEDLLLQTYRVGVNRFPASPVPRVEPIAMGLQQLALREPAAAQYKAEQFVEADDMAAAWATLP
jgi:NitT/TauT family transport system substrate-binding protein